MAYGSINIKSGFYCRVLCSGKTINKSIAISFDDGPDATITPQILGILKDNDIKAAFFCIGQKAADNPDIIRKIDSEGHVIGNHSWSHSFCFDFLSTRRMVDELRKTQNVLAAIQGKKIRMFRPPYGVTNPSLARAAREMNYHLIGWNLRSNDMTQKDENKVLERLKNKIRPGDVILFHDTRENTLKILDSFIRYAKSMNYRFERIDRLLGIDAYE